MGNLEGFRVGDHQSFWSDGQKKQLQEKNKTGQSIYEPVWTQAGNGTERQAGRLFDDIVEASGAFTLFREVPGWYTSFRPETEASSGKSPRIDRILLPTNKLNSSGWKDGAIGIEIKKFDIKAGHGINQCLDYSRSIFILPCGLRVFLKWIFLFPVEMDGGAIGSVMAQNNIGTASIVLDNQVVQLRSNSTIVMQFGKGKIEVRQLKNGKRSGSI